MEQNNESNIIQEMKEKLEQQEQQLAALEAEKNAAQSEQQETKAIAAFFRKEQLSAIASTVAAKIIICGLLSFFLFRNNDGSSGFSLLNRLILFLMFYAVASLFVFSVRKTGNYLVGFVFMILAGIGIITVLDRIDRAFGQRDTITAILIFGLFLFPLALDALRIWRLAKKSRG